MTQPGRMTTPSQIRSVPAWPAASAPQSAPTCGGDPQPAGSGSPPTPPPTERTPDDHHPLYPPSLRGPPARRHSRPRGTGRAMTSTAHGADQADEINLALLMIAWPQFAITVLPGSAGPPRWQIQRRNGAVPGLY